jgi:type II secretory ATPase GspE/PulE/Tfp pilus assembly ATPase PilB-like protein
MVGEVRDFETAEIAMRAALTGHLILTTIHATTASAVIHRIINMKIEPYVISGAFIGALSQRLIRQVCAHCAQPVAINPAWIEGWAKTLEPLQKEFIQKTLGNPQSKFVKGAGCPSCRMTGFKGRVGIFELLAATDEIRNLIFKQASLAEIRQSALKSGMKTLLIDAIEKASKGLTSIEEAIHSVA